MRNILIIACSLVMALTIGCTRENTAQIDADALLSADSKPALDDRFVILVSQGKFGSIVAGLEKKRRAAS